MAISIDVVMVKKWNMIFNMYGTNKGSRIYLLFLIRKVSFQKIYAKSSILKMENHIFSSCNSIPLHRRKVFRQTYYKGFCQLYDRKQLYFKLKINFPCLETAIEEHSPVIKVKIRLIKKPPSKLKEVAREDPSRSYGPAVMSDYDQKGLKRKFNILQK